MLISVWLAEILVEICTQGVLLEAAKSALSGDSGEDSAQNGGISERRVVSRRITEKFERRRTREHTGARGVRRMEPTPRGYPLQIPLAGLASGTVQRDSGGSDLVAPVLGRWTA